MMNYHRNNVVIISKYRINASTKKAKTKHQITLRLPRQNSHHRKLRRRKNQHPPTLHQLKLQPLPHSHHRCRFQIQNTINFST
jgi:hypothetical protein